MSLRKLGREAEKIVESFLRKLNLRILNVKGIVREGFDFIAIDDINKRVYFIEVKRLKSELTKSQRELAEKFTLNRYTVKYVIIRVDSNGNLRFERYDGYPDNEFAYLISKLSGGNRDKR